MGVVRLPTANHPGDKRVWAVMTCIDDGQVAEPGMVILDVTTHDEATAHVVMSALERSWATSGVGPVRREPGESGGKARIYADLRGPGTRA
ncbi:DUF6207 family protein [Streptomyces netropsis]|uniref:Uncharacterized protein n=1 Tax=Streptomyces netropsis TaxID=55404 RepID=A0A7W7LD12_STRNE|nr:DUF6207 family protein [Streptomyces netropsis]MBB4887950.1 hypothetical protein [Streptomyces netropsis]GGR33120.1 hypothetical protein GCM10010219_42570 [Streptomyces netropsis]